MLVKSSRMMNSPASRKTDHSLEQRQFTKKPSKRPQVLMQTPTSPLASSIQSPKHSAVFAQSAARELVARGLPTNAVCVTPIYLLSSSAQNYTISFEICSFWRETAERLLNNFDIHHLKII